MGDEAKNGSAGSEAPPSGMVPYAGGQSSAVRIPVSGTKGLAMEFKPRGKDPAGGSTSTLFFQDVTGKRHLRLDYGYYRRAGFAHGRATMDHD